MMIEDWSGLIIVTILVLFFVGFFVGMGMGAGTADSKWCSRMKDITWGECIANGQQVKVIEDVL